MNVSSCSEQVAVRRSTISLTHRVLRQKAARCMPYLLGGVRMAERPGGEVLPHVCDLVQTAWPVLPTVGPRLTAWAGEEFTASVRGGRIHGYCTAIRELALVQADLTVQLCEALESAHVPYSLLKGSALRWTAYENPEDRGGWDLDVAVPASFLQEAAQVAEAVGFTPAQWDPRARTFVPADLRLRASVEKEHYELGFYVRRYRPWEGPCAAEETIRMALPLEGLWQRGEGQRLECFVTLDLHHGLSPEISAEELVESAVPVKAGKTQFRIPPAEWSVFLTVYKLYWEGVTAYRQGGYQYADLIRMVPRLSDSAIASLLKLFARYKLEVAAYYVLRRFPRMFGVALPDALSELVARMSVVASSESPQRTNDLGDMWPKLWGMR
jgi:hypothetical protein